MSIFKGYRTLAVNILSAAVMVAEMQEFTKIIPADYLPHFSLALALANMLLRTITTTSVGRKA